MAEREWRHWLPKVADFHSQVLKTSGGGGSSYHFKLHSGVRYGLTADLSLLGVSAEKAVKAAVLTLDLEAPNEGPKFEEEPDLDELEQPELFDTSEGESSETEVERELSAKRDSAAAAARRIFLKQRGDPYNRETIIGFPLIGARVGRKKISGPLFYWKVDPQLKAAANRLTLSRPSPSPSLNSLLLSKFTEEDAEIDLVREQLVPVVQSESFDLTSIEKAVRQIRGIFAPLKNLEEKEFEGAPLASFLDTVSNLGGTEAAVLSAIPALVNTSRSFAFILEDLGKLQNLADAAEGSVVSGFVGELPEEVERADERGLPFYDTMDGGDPLWFPMESNDAQRRVGRKARRVRTLAVQGPPGTGKSQTIANLVCDLVAEGKSVLVTSHTQKALEVLADKLPPVDHLAVSVLRSDRASITKLRSELEAVQESGDRDPGLLQRAVERAEGALRELDSELRHLDRRYSELRQLESEEFSKHLRLTDIREYDRIHPEDRPDLNQSDRIAEALQEYARRLLDLLPAIDHFRTFYRPDDETTRIREAQRYKLLDASLNLYSGISEAIPEASLKFADDFVGEHGLDEGVEEKLYGWSEWLRTTGSEIEGELRWIVQGRDTKGAISEVLECARSLGDTDEPLKHWQRHESYFQETDLTGEEVPEQFSPSKRQEVEAAIKRLRVAHDSFLSWHLTLSARRARKTLERAGFAISGRKEAADQLEGIEAILKWLAHRQKCEQLSDTYDGFLSDVASEPIEGIASTRRLVRHARERVRVLKLIDAVASSPLIEAESVRLEKLGQTLLLEVGGERSDHLAHIAEGAARRLKELRSAQAIESVLDVTSDWREHKAQLLRAVRERDRGVAESRWVEQLEALAQHYPEFRRVVDLGTTTLASLPRTLDRLEAELRDTGKIPEWVREVDLALEAHRLSSLLRQSLAANPDDLTEIAERLAEGKEKRREIILRIVERRRELGVRKAVRSPATNNALLNMRDLLGRKRMTQSFLSLRDQIEYRELLKLFPCWICSIDDVARLFPLETGLFDYLIVDEASQCPQTALLPLALRARRAIVVGDRKQLQPAGARFLSGDAIDVMAQRAGITEHPVVEAFDGQKSLLDVAERYREDFDFLDEHFRCDPDIIRWSNSHFYHNRLKILTHRRNRVFNPALEVRELKDADDDREKKTNRREAEAVVAELRRIIDAGEAERMTIGVISPYRKQADLLNKLIEHEFASQPELKRRMGLLASTADGFQGDERDIILYSFRYGPSSHPATVTSIQREAERLNVAFSRAKRKVICFVSHSPNRFPKGLIRSFLEHAKETERKEETGGRRPDQFDSKFEEEVCFALRDRGLGVTTQEPVAGYRIDLVVEDDQGRILGVECDGEFKFNPLGELRPKDYQRQDVIERAGWVIHRISGRSWLANPEREIDRVVAVLESLPSAKEREIQTGPRVSTEEPPGEPEAPEKAEEKQVSVSDTVLQQEETVPREAGVLTEFGETPQDQVAGVKRLWRWLLLKGHLEGSALDALSEIEEKLEGGKALTPSDLGFLEELLYSAYRRGYNPETAEDLPDQPRPLGEIRFSRDEKERTEPTAQPSEPDEEKPWDDEELSDVQHHILDYLWESRPEGRDKYEISGHLVSDCNFPREAAHPSRVNHHLYGPLSDWVEKKGNRPPRWFVRSSSDE